MGKQGTGASVSVQKKAEFAASGHGSQDKHERILSQDPSKKSPFEARKPPTYYKCNEVGHITVRSRRPRPALLYRLQTAPRRRCRERPASATS